MAIHSYRNQTVKVGVKSDCLDRIHILSAIMISTVSYQLSQVCCTFDPYHLRVIRAYQNAFKLQETEEKHCALTNLLYLS